MSTKDAIQRSWSGPRPFVGRDAEIADLLGETDSVLAEGGRAVFLLGDAGAGKTALLGAFEEFAHRRHAELETGSAICVADERQVSAWERLHEHFTYSARMRRAAISLVPEWLEVIPIVGGLFAAVAVTIQRLRGRPVRRDKQARASATTISDHVRALVEHGKNAPCLVMLDQLERASPDELAGASALMRWLEESRILVVFAVRTEKGRPPDAVRTLLLEAERKGRSKQIELKGFDRDELLEVVSLVVRGMISPDWLDWLQSGSGGRPGQLWSLLADLEHTRKLKRTRRSWEFTADPPEPPRSETDDPDPILDQVTEDARRMLAVAAVEGEVFHSTILAELSGIPELELEDRLAPLVRARVITHLGEYDLGPELTSRYSFGGMRSARAFAALLSSNEREALEGRLQEIRQALGSTAPG